MSSFEYWCFMMIVVFRQRYVYIIWDISRTESTTSTIETFIETTHNRFDAPCMRFHVACLVLSRHDIVWITIYITYVSWWYIVFLYIRIHNMQYLLNQVSNLDIWNSCKDFRLLVSCSVYAIWCSTSGSTAT